MRLFRPSPRLKIDSIERAIINMNQPNRAEDFKKAFLPYNDTRCFLHFDIILDLITRKRTRESLLGIQMSSNEEACREVMTRIAPRWGPCWLHDGNYTGYYMLLEFDSLNDLIIFKITRMPELSQVVPGLNDE